MTFGCPFQSTSLYEIKLSSCKVEHCSQERGDESFPPVCHSPAVESKAA